MQTLDQENWDSALIAATAAASASCRHSLVGAGRLTGKHLYNLQGDSLGSIFEIMLDLASGRVTYAVLDSGCGSRFNRRLHAVPWEALQHDSASGRLLLNIEHERLQDAPAFEPNAWPDMADPEWVSALHAYYGSRARPNGYVPRPTLG